MPPCRRPQGYVLFQFDYRPADLGLLFAFVPDLGVKGAAKVVFGCNEVETHEKKQQLVRVLLSNRQQRQQILAYLDQRLADGDPKMIEWVEDLALLARQAAWHQHRHWLRPTAQSWGKSLAERSIRAFDDLMSRVRAEPVGDTLPFVFGEVPSGLTLIYWQPTEFRNEASRCPRRQDPTYAAFRFRVTECGEVEYSSRVDNPDEAPGILTQVKHVWTGTLMVCWLQQAAQSCQCDPVNARVICDILLGIISMLAYAKGESRQAKPAGFQ